MPSFTRCGLRDAGDVLPFEQHLARLGGSTPVRRLMKVVLPAPLGPISAWRAPGSSRKSTSRDAVSAPKVLLRAGFEQRVAHGGARVRRKRCVSASPRPRMPLRANSAIDDQQQADAELPGRRIGLRQEVLERHVDDGADEGAVEPAVAAEDQDDEHGGRAVEAERAQVDVGVRLRPQGAGDAGDRRGNGVADDQPRSAPARRPRACAACSRGCPSGSARTANRPACARTRSTTNRTASA